MWGGNFAPHTSHGPQMAPYHLSSLIVQDRTIYSCIRTLGNVAPKQPFAFLNALIPPSSILVQERKYPLLGTPEMSDKLRYEWRLYLDTLAPDPSPFVRPYFLSSVIVQERKLYTRYYTPFLGTPEMSDKLRYQWQIILRYFTHIIYHVSLERPTTSPFSAIHLERQTTPHFLSLWTTHLQYRPKYYAYSLSQ